MARRRNDPRPSSPRTPEPAKSGRRVIAFVVAAVLAAVAAQLTGITGKMIDAAVAWVHPTAPLTVTGERIGPSPAVRSSPSSAPVAAPPSPSVRTGRISDALYECGRLANGFVVARDTADIEAPDGGYDDAPEKVDDWISRYDAGDRHETHYQVEVQGKAGKTVVLRRMFVDYLDRAGPPATAAVVQLEYEECGDPTEPRYFTADLDDPSGRMGPDDGTPDFPYRISNSDPEIFRLTAVTQACDCRWRIALEWTSDGATGTTYVEETFHTVADRNYPRIAWTSWEGPWKRRDPL
ncbi:hypothetical protein HH310_14370 [Actinoplanes sp. TBRC 11911]|uniref:hypothetical protein n=1 Tax=Actinoplanes sp. TBRC 11911 TaxID=2729386 RepID=UPI00145D0A46|nr:hypothetical protein [Actinoplanes sp. TBRC 11911]NMO52377.1 hypothetical protein [Actinoplanes sp. TBRC 11911]